MPKRGILFLNKYQVEIEFIDKNNRTITVKSSEKQRALIQALNEIPLHDRDYVISAKIIGINSF